MAFWELRAATESRSQRRGMSGAMFYYRIQLLGCQQWDLLWGSANITRRVPSYLYFLGIIPCICLSFLKSNTYRSCNSYNMNLLNPLRPLAKLFPKIEKPLAPLTMQQRTVFTAITLFIYLVCSQIPLYGIVRTQDSDPLYWARVIMASSKGTLMELGISPIISAGWMTQILAAIGLFKITSSQDEKDSQGLESILGMIFCFGEAVVSIWYGNYGIPSEMSLMTMALIVAQLMGAGLIVILLDDMLRRGYGLGSGISLFLLANTSETIFWFAFSPVTMISQFGVEFQGAFIALVHFLMTKKTAWQAVVQAFSRENGFNLSQLLGSGVIFTVLIYLQRFSAKVSFIHQRFPGYKGTFDIKLFFTSNMSVILQGMLISNFYKVSMILHDRFHKSALIKLIGTWEGDRITGGVLWYIAPPYDLTEAIAHPHRTIFYIAFVCLLCAQLTKLWIVISKSSPRDYALNVRSSQLTMPNFKEESVIGKFNKMIPTAAMLGGATIGFLTVMGDLFNVAGSSTGIMLSISILYGYYQKIFEKRTVREEF